MAAYELLLLNTAVPQIQAAQSGDTYVVPRDIAFSAALTLSAGTANGVPYLNASKVLTTGSALTFDGTNLLNDQSTASPIGIRLRNGSTSTSAGTRVAFEFGGTTTGYIGNQFDGGDFNTQYMAAQNHIWYRGVSDAMILTSTGLGIGTNNPAVKLDVQTSAQQIANLASSNADGGYINLGRTGAVALLGSYNATSGGGSTINADALFFRNANGIGFGSGGATVTMSLDSSGNLGLGVTPSAWTRRAMQLDAGGSAGYYSVSNGTAVFSSNVYYGSGDKYVNTNYAGYYAINPANGTHTWAIAPSGTAGNAISFTQAMTLDASGNLLVGATSSSETSGVGHKVNTSATAPWMATVGSVSTDANVSYSLYSTGAAAYRFYVGFGGTVFATSNTISAISDQRLKENVQDLDVGLDAVMALKPRKFDWKSGKGKDIKGDRGWIAQEFEQVFPDMIDTWKDEAPEGEEPYKSVRADLIPILVKAIQEQQAMINELKAKVAALQGA